MKLTKSQLKQIIKEEMAYAFEGQDPDPEQDEERPKIPYDDEGNLLWDSVEMPGDLNQRATALWEHLNGLLTQWRPTEGQAIDYKLDLFTLLNDFLTSPDRPSPGGSEYVTEGGEDHHGESCDEAHPDKTHNRWRQT
jgi:hypothetical protein|tara:strand:- start:14209 stop:14619 length:411 start_codon:yes stop_codon:yes gene_type:complete